MARRSSLAQALPPGEKVGVLWGGFCCEPAARPQATPPPHRTVGRWGQRLCIRLDTGLRPAPRAAHSGVGSLAADGRSHEHSVNASKSQPGGGVCPEGYDSQHSLKARPGDQSHGVPQAPPEMQRPWACFSQ